MLLEFPELRLSHDGSSRGLCQPVHAGAVQTASRASYVATLKTSNNTAFAADRNDAALTETEQRLHMAVDTMPQDAIADVEDGDYKLCKNSGLASGASCSLCICLPLLIACRRTAGRPSDSSRAIWSTPSLSLLHLCWKDLSSIHRRQKHGPRNTAPAHAHPTHWYSDLLPNRDAPNWVG